MKYLNTACYHFFEVTEYLERLRKLFKRKCDTLKLMGTVIIAPEGINSFVVGTEKNIEEFKQFLRDVCKQPNLAFKDSWSDHIPFTRMLVKVKEQIIPVNDPRINPKELKGTHLAPEKFKQWLDEKKDIVVLDTRNEFEVKIGTFEKAVDFNLKHFRDFEDKLKETPDAWKEKPIVMFCTGGIRCEKAAPLMVKHGFKNVFQLDGGILNYFEKIGGEHYQGDCFVFDKRVALNPQLDETEVVECFACRHPVTPQEQKLDTYKYEKHCPYCYESYRTKSESTQ